MKVLVACEYSGIVRDAFLKKGHNAISCDLLDTESPIIYDGGHYIGDVRDILYDDWDLMIAHPPCTYLSVTGTRWLYHPEDMHMQKELRRPHPKFPDRPQKMLEAIDFVKTLMDAPIEKIAVENPLSVISSHIRKADQCVQPYHFGHLEQKRTCLWLKNLPKLKKTHDRTDEVMAMPKSERAKVWAMPPSEERSKLRSLFFTGIAEAMADQWG